MKILVIDDKEDIRETLRDILEINGHEVLTAEDGVAGVKLAKQRPDFIFCDVAMPNLDGYGALAAIKAMPEARDVPFVFLTAKADRGDQREGMTLGADDYITKPFTERDVIDAIAARTHRHRGVREKVEHMVEQHRRQINAHWSHELLTPLNAVMGALEVLNLESGTISQAELKEMLGLIRVGAERQERLARKLIRYFSLEQRLQAPRSGGPERCKAEVAVTAGAAQAGHEQKRAGDLVISVEPAEIAVHPEGLQDAVYEIVSNALTFSAGNTPVTVNGRKHERRYRIEISDQGPGMSAAERAAIGAFTQFGREKREQQGLGLGLAIAAASARLAQGEFSLAAGENDRGLKAIFDLPLAL